MCRLFGLHAGTAPVRATFWLLSAPESLSRQSRLEPDGAGIGTFDLAGTPVVTKQPIAAWRDRQFAEAARDVESTTFLAHVRYASVGAHTPQNTHPFEQDGRIFAHNGAFHRLDLLDVRLAELGAANLVLGQTDSERMFALITAETRRSGGDVEAGIAAAVSWLAANLPVYSLNFILTTSTDLWALRYPETHGLYVLHRPPGGSGRQRHLDAHSPRIHAHSHALASAASVVLASRPMDGEPGWEPLRPGELLHVDSGLRARSSFPFPPRPAHLLRLQDLDAATAASQHPGP